MYYLQEINDQYLKKLYSRNKDKLIWSFITSACIYFFVLLSGADLIQIQLSRESAISRHIIIVLKELNSIKAYLKYRVSFPIKSNLKKRLTNAILRMIRKTEKMLLSRSVNLE